jgi:hypothetical protein
VQQGANSTARLGQLPGCQKSQFRQEVKLVTTLLSYEELLCSHGDTIAVLEKPSPVKPGQEKSSLPLGSV